MATIYWLGTATTAAQVATATFATYDVTTTRIITIGGVAVSLADSGGTLTAALSAFATTLNNSTHPYFAAITWTSNATQIIGTADTAGCPFVFAGSVSGGTGTCSNAYTVSTANSGPNDWSVATNWSGGAVPVNDDVVIIKDSSVNICWGLDQSAVSLDNLQIHQSYLGKIGLRYYQFATSANGDTYSATTKPEYRDKYLKIIVTGTDGPVEIGQNVSQSTPTGSSRLCLDLHTTAANVIVYNTCNTSAESGLPCVRLKAASASTDVFVRSSPGGVGVAAYLPGETSTVRKVSIADTTTASRVYIGEGTTITTYEQSGGINFIDLETATLTTATVRGGQLTVEGDQVITTINVHGGTVYSHQTGTVGTGNLYGGTVDLLGSQQARTWTTTNMYAGATLKRDSAVVTLTTLNVRGTLTAS